MMTRSALAPVSSWGLAVARGLAVVTGLGTLAAVAPAAAAPCATLAPGQVVLQPVYPSPTLDTSLGLAGLARRAEDRDVQRGAGGQPLGLTVAKLVESLEADGDFAVADPRAPAGDVCGVAAEVRVRLGFEDTIIYVAREVTSDSCLYGEVYRHEWRHVQVDRDLVALFGPRIETGLRALIARLGIVRGASVDAVWSVIRERLNTAITADVEALEIEMRQRQDAIDQPAEYRRISEVCGGAGARLIAGMRRPG